MKRNVLARRAASAALAACMMFSLSAPALAASNDALLQQSAAAKSAVSVLDEENGMTEEPVYDEMDLNRGSITVYIGEDGKQYAKQGENDPQKRGNLQITTNGGQTTNTLTILGGDSTAAKVTLSNVNINTSGAAVSVSGNVELYITGTNILRSGWERAGLEKADDDGTLTIDGTGTLNAYGGNHAAGIGSSVNNNVRNIVINGGTITAECTGDDGAGIGGGHHGVAKNIRINGGVVTATGGEWGFGIGSGYNEYSLLPTTITITGGTVKAIAKNPGGAIGALASANDLTMTGGSLTVQKSNDRWGWIISPSSTIGEVDKNSLTGAITYLDQNGKVVDEIVQDFNIKINGESVTSKNYNDILGICYDIKEKTLKLKDGKPFDGNLTIDAPADVSIDLEANASHVVNGNLTVTGAKDVTVTSDRYDAIQGEADINCTGKVNIRSDKSMAVNGSLNIYDSSEVTLSAGSNVVNGSANITSNGNVAIYSTVGRAAQKLTINNAENVTISIRDSNKAVSEDTKITASGTVILKNNAQGGCVGTVNFTQAGGKKYVYYTSEGADAKLIDPRIHPLAEAAESSYLRIEPRETYSITVANGTAQVGEDTTGRTSAFEGETVTVRANKLPDEVAAGTEFYGWEVARDSTAFTLTEGKLGSKEEAGTEKISFEMPKGDVKLTACWSASSLDPNQRIDPNEPLDEDFGVEPAPMDTTGGTIAAVAVGGAAIWGGYEVVTRVILNELLPEGAAIPANRGQLALLVWNTAGRPEPAGAPAFADVADTDMAKAAQWCTEQGTMAAKGDRFEPEGWTPKFKVIEVWNKAFPKQ